MVRGRFLYSGGIGTLEDLRALKALRLVNLAGVISGKALYERRFTVARGRRRWPTRSRVSGCVGNDELQPSRTRTRP